ncbi:MAG: DUF1007 family protein [Deltaproteobacteria bacterium]|nr:DUF1007 family protein [Deltaproteobacteria bacterium]
MILPNKYKLKIMNRRVCLFTVLLLLGFSRVLFSHPHIFVANSLSMVFDDQGLAGVRVKWDFDEFFSSMIVGDYDLNKNSKLDTSEIALIKKEAFANLAEFKYFTFIKINGKSFDVQYVLDFQAILIQGKLVYEFFIPCHVKAASSFKEFAISQYDTTYYTYVGFAKDRPSRIEGGAAFEINHRIAENPNETYYFGMMHPVEVILRFRLKK